MSEPFKKETYFVMALDPVHVGTGGYRLGRVDNTITREPGTNIPKIPGSSISGAVRAYTAMAVQSEINGQEPFEKQNGGFILKPKVYAKMAYQRPVYSYLDEEKGILKPSNDMTPLIETDKQGKDKYYSCVGKGADDGMGHCGEPDCPVCVAFGFSKKRNSFQGLAQFFDARILFFPVHSMIGPVWITSPAVLGEHVINNVSLSCNEKFLPLGRTNHTGPLNFGWLYLEAETPPNNVSVSLHASLPDEIMKNSFMVSDAIFSRIVNDNLEVRTSVAINPATGAAEDGALFTYEAIPRSSILWFDVVYNKPEFFRIEGGKAIVHGKSRGNGYEWVKDNVEKGLNYLEALGVGGMNTRGMGRLRWLKGGAS